MKNPFRQTLPDGTTFDMMLVEGGAFMMGSEDYTQSPIHEVILSSFYMGKYPITQDLFKAVLNGNNPSYFKGDRRPVEQVSWFDAVVFCNVLNEICGYKSCYFSDASFEHIYGKNTEGGYNLLNEGKVYLKQNVECYRLPTEAEWEYAARGGNQSGGYYYAGGDKMNELGWFDYNSHKETKPVGLKLENELGIYEMSGNVWEWCGDWWYDGHFYQKCFDSGTVKNPFCSEEGAGRVFRGGSWDYGVYDCRPRQRYDDTPTLRAKNIGFRLVFFSLSI